MRRPMGYQIAGGSILLRAFQTVPCWTMCLGCYTLKLTTHNFIFDPCRTLMAHYSNATQVTKDYVTRTHCDDMVMNAVASYHTGKPPLRVQLPPESIIDYFELCRRTRRDLTGGVSLKPGWKNNRGQCAYFVQTQYNFPYKTTDEVGVCNSANTHFKPQCRVEARRWTRMFSGSGCNTGWSSHFPQIFCP